MAVILYGGSIGSPWRACVFWFLFDYRVEFRMQGVVELNTSAPVKRNGKAVYKHFLVWYGARKWRASSGYKKKNNQRKDWSQNDIAPGNIKLPVSHFQRGVVLVQSTRNA